jgi:hypothetical protein
MVRFGSETGNGRRVDIFVLSVVGRYDSQGSPSTDQPCVLDNTFSIANAGVPGRNQPERFGN